MVAGRLFTVAAIPSPICRLVARQGAELPEVPPPQLNCQLDLLVSGHGTEEAQWTLALALALLSLCRQS